jgi:hypothetical protein
MVLIIDVHIYAQSKTWVNVHWKHLTIISGAEYQMISVSPLYIPNIVWIFKSMQMIYE